MKAILNHLFTHKKLSRREAEEVLTNIGQGIYNESEIAAFMSVYIMRSVSVDELAGFRDALLSLCLHVDFPEDTIDLCGTGGDGKDTFNISTLSSFVVAGAGGKVAKHGNYGVSSTCGSSNVMEYLGYKFTNDLDTLRRQLDKAGIFMMHAPLFHPAMKHVAPIRKKLAVKTFFNMLGPMVNPAMPNYQMVGVFSLELARLYQYIYQQSNKNYLILHSLDGYDEISLTGKFKVIANRLENVLSPADLGMRQVQPSELFSGGTVEEAARIFRNVLENNATEAQKNAVLANSGMAIKCLNPRFSFEESILAAKESIESGKALFAFKTLLENQ